MSFDPSKFTSLDAAMGAALDESYRLATQRRRKMPTKSPKKKTRKQYDGKVYGLALRMRANRHQCTLPPIQQLLVFDDHLFAVDKHGNLWERHAGRGSMGTKWTRSSMRAKDATSDNPPPVWTPTFFENKPLEPFLDAAEEAIENGDGNPDFDE